jgi:hypothetical protein
VGGPSPWSGRGFRASQLVFKDDEWKPLVSELMSLCPAVFIFAGNSDGVLWEISEAARLVAPSRIFISLDYVPKAKRREVGAALSRALPGGAGGPILEYPRNFHWLTFRDDWKPEFWRDLSKLTFR